MTSSSSGPDPKRYQIFVSSTYKDLISERQAVTQAVLHMGRCIPAGMELFSASNQPPWEVIRQALDGTDYLVLIIGNRFGEQVPNEKISYTEKEYRYAIDNNIPVLAFLSSAAHPLLPKDIESTKARTALAAFRKRVQSAQLTEEWTTAGDLAGRVTNALWRAFNDTPRPGWVRGDLLSALEQPAPAPSAPPPFENGSGIPESAPIVSADEHRAALTREIDSIVRCARQQGWKVLNNSRRVLRLQDPRGHVHECVRVTAPEENRKSLRRFAGELRAAGLRVNRLVRQPVSVSSKNDPGAVVLP